MSESTDQIAVRSVHRDYTVDFVEDAASFARTRLDATRIFTVCDERVYGLWHEYLEPLVEAGPHVLLAPTEDSKTIGCAESLVETMVRDGVRRDHVVLAIGGGITQDVAAFAAS